MTAGRSRRSSLTETQRMRLPRSSIPMGRVISASGNIAGLGPSPIRPNRNRFSVLSRSCCRATTTPSGCVSKQISVAGQPFVAHVGISADEVGDAGQALVVSLIVIVPIVVVMLAALVWWLVGRTLVPVESIRHEADAIDGGDLRRRVPQPETDDEIARLAATMNRMLDRIEQGAGSSAAIRGRCVARAQEPSNADSHGSWKSTSRRRVR